MNAATKEAAPKYAASQGQTHKGATTNKGIVPMNIAGNFDTEQQEMLHEAGFTPCYVKDLSDGDTIAIDHALNREAPTEMVVTSLWLSPVGSGNVISNWIGLLPSGRGVHCSYGAAFPVYRQVQS